MPGQQGFARPFPALRHQSITTTRGANLEISISKGLRSNKRTPQRNETGRAIATFLRTHLLQSSLAQRSSLTVGPASVRQRSLNDSIVPRR